MTIKLYLDLTPTDAQMKNLYHFLLNARLAPQGSKLLVTGPQKQEPLLKHEAFPITFEGEEPRFEVAFLNESKLHNAALLKNKHLPKLLIGRDGLPESITHAAIPFEGRGFRTRWVGPVLEKARQFQWRVHLLHSDHGIVPFEIMRLADWFRAEGIKEALSSWVTDDARRALGDLVLAYPDVEIRASVGKTWTSLKKEADGPVFLMGSLKAGYHIPNRHHGLNYGKLLMQTGGSGYFLAE